MGRIDYIIIFGLLCFAVLIDHTPIRAASVVGVGRFSAYSTNRSVQFGNTTTAMIRKTSPPSGQTITGGPLTMQGNGTSDRRLLLDLGNSWPYGVTLSVPSDGDVWRRNIRFDSPVVIGNNESFTFGSSGGMFVRNNTNTYQSSGNDFFEFSTNLNSVQQASGFFSFNPHGKPPSNLTAGVNPRVRIYSGLLTGYADSNDNNYIGLYHDQTNPVIEWGSGNLQLSGSGNVGIGTTTPTSKLTVAGTIETTTGGVKFPDGTVQTTAGEPANSNIQAHIGATNNPHSTTANQVGAEPTIGYPSVDYDCAKRQTQASGGAWSFGSCGSGGSVDRSAVVTALATTPADDTQPLTYKSAAGTDIFHVDTATGTVTITGSLTIK